jgi:hypothetical protein
MLFLETQMIWRLLEETSMKLGKYTSANPWLFIGLSASPCLILFVVLACLFAFGKHTAAPTSEIPDWVWCAAFSCLPLFAGIVGFALAYYLSDLFERQHWLAVRPLTNIYIAVFALAWNVVFGFLSFFVFVMGFGDGPVVTTMKQFGQLFTGILTIGFPEAILISLVVCSLATAIVIVVLEAIVPRLIKP